MSDVNSLIERVRSIRQGFTDIKLLAEQEIAVYSAFDRYCAKCGKLRSNESE